MCMQRMCNAAYIKDNIFMTEQYNTQFSQGLLNNRNKQKNEV